MAERPTLIRKFLRSSVSPSKSISTLRTDIGNGKYGSLNLNCFSAILPVALNFFKNSSATSSFSSTPITILYRLSVLITFCSLSGIRTGFLPLPNHLYLRKFGVTDALMRVESSNVPISFEAKITESNDRRTDDVGTNLYSLSGEILALAEILLALNRTVSLVCASMPRIETIARSFGALLPLKSSA